MSDDKDKLGFQDRNRVAGFEAYEVGYFASKFGLSARVRELIAKHGNDRETLEREAKALGNRFQATRERISPSRSHLATP